ncbi:Blue copper protein [Spatholobus suberectus]|nr:Blue copper protein [Spatholobus suberectus]
MASAPRLAFLAISMVLLSSVAMATDFVVGDGKGWGLDFNYTEWAKDKVFHVGDNLDNEAFSSGKDSITLKAEGKKWYICGKANHCADHQMKLVINVEAVGPASVPTSSAYSMLSSLSGVLKVAVAAIFAVRDTWHFSRIFVDSFAICIAM